MNNIKKSSEKINKVAVEKTSALDEQNKNDLLFNNIAMENLSYEQVAKILSVSSSLIVLFSFVCEIDSCTGFIYIDVFISPNSYMLLNKYGNVVILGKSATKKLLANLVVSDIISKWSILEASIPAGAINCFIVFVYIND